MGVPAGVSRGTRTIGKRIEKERKLKGVYKKIAKTWEEKGKISFCVS